MIISLLAISNVAPSGCIVAHSEHKIFQLNKFDFYNRAYSQEFSPELLKECLYYEKIDHPDIVFRQSELETGYYTSELFWIANNLFGMRLAQVRETTAAGIYRYHARYDHWTDSVKDYKLWQEYYKSLGYNFSDEYLVFLNYIGYATDPNYILKITT